MATVPTTKPWDCGLHDAHENVRPAERRVLWVVAITVATMLLELVVGYWSQSLALLADGWHMASHAGALGLSAGAYWLARVRATQRMFVFGTGKVYALAGYTNAIGLGFVAVWMAIEGIHRLRHPENIVFSQALPVAVLGLLVNLVCAWLLGGGHEHGHEHHHHEGHDHHHEHKDHDHNLRSAYMHVLADALTSVLAIAALTAGWIWGLNFLDPAIALVASLVILHWSVNLCRSASRQLLDLTPSVDTESKIRATLCAIDDVRVTDLHLWEIGPKKFGCVVTLVTNTPREVREYRSKLLAAVGLAHLTVEVHRGV